MIYMQNFASSGLGDLVYARNFQSSCVWSPGVVTEISGPLSTVIRLKEGQIVHHHIDHVKLRNSTSDQQESGHASPGAR